MLVRDWQSRVKRREQETLKKRGVCDFFVGGSGGGSVIDTGDIGHSLRFRASASTYISKTLSAGSDRKKLGFLFAFKRGLLGVQQMIISTYNGDSGNYTHIYFNAADRLVFVGDYLNGNLFEITTSSVFRNVGWNFGAVLFDSTQATQADRAQIWTRGNTGDWQRHSVTGTLVPLNAQLHINGPVTVNIGRTLVGANYFDGHLARLCLVADSTPVQTGYAYLNSQINTLVVKSQAQVKAVVDAGGTNSFMLDFDNGTNLTTLGYDKSAKGNNWTLNNFSLTAGPSYDWMDDRPGNSYATLNPLDVYGGTATLSDGNLTGSLATVNGCRRSTMSVSSGKWYWEVTIGDSLQYHVTGVSDQTCNGWSVTGTGGSATGNGWFYVGRSAGSWSTEVSSNTFASYGASFTLNDVIGVALDMNAGTITFYKNGVSQGVAYSNLGGKTLAPTMAQSNGSACVDYFNFGQRPFTYTPPTGFKSLCQANLPDIPAATLNPLRHAAVVIRAGTGATTSVSSLLFQPDFFDGKSRNNARSWRVVDSVRGALNRLATDLTDAETADSGGLTAFLANGYSLGNNVNYNGATDTFLDLLLKAGGASVTNNAGSIQSQVSANVAAGFSIVAWTGTGANATVGHGLPVAPRMIIVKSKSSGSWYAYVRDVGAGYYLVLNQTSSATPSSTVWNNTTPTSTVFSLGVSASNVSGEDFIAYCFADNRDLPGGIFRCFSYQGNASADGAYFDLGGKALWAMFKNASTAGTNWPVIDTVRDQYNPAGLNLYANLPAAEDDYRTSRPIDFLGSGIKARTDTANINGSGLIVGLAILGCHGKYS